MLYRQLMKNWAVNRHGDSSPSFLVLYAPHVMT